MSSKEVMNLTDQGKNSLVNELEQNWNSSRSGFDASLEEIWPNGSSIKQNEEGAIKIQSLDDRENRSKRPVQAFVANIVFPKTLEEVLDYSYVGCYNVEDILYDDIVTWTVPNWAKIGDIAFFMHSKTSIQTISMLCKELKSQNRFSPEEAERLKEWLDKGRELYSLYGGKIYAYGRVCGSPGTLDDEMISHWKTRIYADIEDIQVLDKPIDISEFNDFLLISRTGSITPVYGEEFEKLKLLVLRKNGYASGYFLDTIASPVPLAKMDETNWLSVANEYRRSFLLERQFRSFYVDRFLPYFGDQKKTYRECRCRKQGIPDSFVDNVILFNGKYLPVEIKLNINKEEDLPGQVKKYCNDDVRFTDTSTDKVFDNTKSYMNQVLIIDTEAVYLYDDRLGEIEFIKSLDEMQTIEDIKQLRTDMIARIKN